MSRGCYMSPVFKIKTIPALIPTTLMMLVALTGCQDDSSKRTDVRTKDDKPSPHLENKADRQENKADRLEDRADRLENKADETRDTTRPTVGEKIDDKVDDIEDRIDDRNDNR
jgi:hypothetical protein